MFNPVRTTIIAVVSALFPLAAGAGCHDQFVELKGNWGQARFRVELAQTDAERSQGLMFRDSMSAGAGMLFVYPDIQRNIAFWMRNTLIPLDILFFDDGGTLTRLHAMATPHDDTPIPGGAGVRFVLEINGGLAEQMGIKEGTQMRHPSINQNSAVWRC